MGGCPATGYKKETFQGPAVETTHSVCKSCYEESEEVLTTALRNGSSAIQEPGWSSPGSGSHSHSNHSLPGGCSNVLCSPQDQSLRREGRSALPAKRTVGQSEDTQEKKMTPNFFHDCPRKNK